LRPTRRSSSRTWQGGSPSLSSGFKRTPAVEALQLRGELTRHFFLAASRCFGATGSPPRLFRTHCGCPISPLSGERRAKMAKLISILIVVGVVAAAFAPAAYTVASLA
jgi:hypothetical protein